MSRFATRMVGTIGVGALLTTAIATSANATGTEHEHERAGVQHVLLLSVDGMHQSDLVWYVQTHPGSALAELVGAGTQFTSARTPVPSDSFPGMVGQVTGGNPRSTGIYYDDSWNNALLPAGTTNCVGATPGAEVAYFETLDKNPTSIDAGQGLAGLPGSILQMTANPGSLIDPTLLPVDPATCQPVYPHSYLKVNTVFEVAKAAGLRTAWIDKHPAYEILSGPSGQGIDDLFTPEINSGAPTAGASIDWTKDNALTQQYDSYKVQALLNEIAGFDHSGSTKVGVPAIFGMNFQSVSTAEKLPQSGGLPGGYLADGVTPGPVLSSALDFINARVGDMQAALDANHLTGSTVIILSAKHGQSPQEPGALTRIPDGPIFDALNKAWKDAGHTADLAAFSINDDAMVVWLTDHSKAAVGFAVDFLMHHSGIGNDITGAAKPYTASGLQRVYAGRDAARFFGVRRGDVRVPDLYGVVQHGVVYTGGKGKIAEHGGADPQDRAVPLVVSGAGVESNHVVTHKVTTTQIAPTILQLLGLNPEQLRAVRIEGTEALLGD
jgi:hypothetical protein